MRNNKSIIIGIGNTGRKDDGLGWLFIDSLKQNATEKMDLAYRYQLQIEDAELICNYDTVIFVDAMKDHLEEGFIFKKCKPSSKYSFSTHALVPETVLQLANDLYQKKLKAHILGIQGYEWDLKIGLSPQAQNNLNKAKAYFFNNILN
ncbi:MAG: hydrogenase maturation protease [Flavobacteriaceae bacterium]|nr:hydrogenase maturation protease [Flavobacteriaceae bacterium]